jgi:hypothetical protein
MKQIIKIIDTEFELELNSDIKIDGLIGYPQFVINSENDEDYGVRYASNEIQECELELVDEMAKQYTTHGILEIGVARPKNGDSAFTYKYLKNKSNKIPYVAVDIDDKTYSYAETNRIGDHIWYISDVNKFKSHYPTWDWSYNLEQTLVQMHDKMNERMIVTDCN